MSKCATCGKLQAERCENGAIPYLAGEWPCFQNPNQFEPRITRPELLERVRAAPVEVADEWAWTPEPTTDGLEDLL